MLLALVDSLRCPNAHQESALVLSVEEWHGLRVSRGTLGCPICHARYPVDGGVVDFTGGVAIVRQGAAPSTVDPIRLAAQLSLTEPGGVLLLTGSYAGAAALLSEVADVTCLVVDPPGADGVRIEVAERLPLSSGALRAAAVDASRATPTFLVEVTRALRDRGRLVAPAEALVPPGVEVVVRDEQEWVGWLKGPAAIVPLRRASAR